MKQTSPSLIIKACRFIEESDELPTLMEVAGHVNLSPAYFHKTFTKALGISPRHFADALRFKRLRKSLRDGNDIARALYDSGFGASSRLYEFAGRFLGMTPKRYKQKGTGLVISYSITRTSLGLLLVAATDKGLCVVRFGENKASLARGLKQEFANAQLRENSPHLNIWIKALIDYLEGHKPWPLLPYDLKATAFQRRVWEFLRAIPSGQTYQYAQAARAIGAPKAARAVARACATNPVAIVIPCHRIVPKSGGVGGYRWKASRKRKLLKLENS